MHGLHVWIAALLVARVLVLAQSESGSSQSNDTHLDDVDCSVDDDGRHETLDKCLRIGHRFVKKYIKALGQGDKNFDVCENSVKFVSCLEPLLDRCPSIRHVLHGHWRNVLAEIKCACDENKPECRENLKCLADEYQSLLVARCNALFKFNTRQNTRDDCHFLREAINCKDALITSQCGDVTGQFAYHLFRIHYDDFILKTRCHLPRTPTYKGFRYTDNNGQCKNFLPEMTTCVHDNISRKQMLTFREDNDLVIEESFNKKKIKEACSRYRKYESCMKPIQDRCPVGPSLIYEIDLELRHYRLKMEYICKTARKNYLPHVRCYNRIHTDGTLKQCNEHVWDDVATYLDNITSYQIYCQPHLPTVKGLKQELDKVRLCYEEVVSNECNRTASETLSQLMKIAFSDPEYLHQQFVPDCDLHRPTSLSTTTTPPTGGTATTLRRRHGQHRKWSTSHRVGWLDSSTTTTTTTSPDSRGRGTTAGGHVTKPTRTPPEADHRATSEAISGAVRPSTCVTSLLTCVMVAVGVIGSVNVVQIT